MLWAMVLVMWGFGRGLEPTPALAPASVAIEATETVAPRPAGRPQRARAEQLAAEHAAHPTGAIQPVDADWWERALEDEAAAAARDEAGAPPSDETSETP